MVPIPVIEMSRRPGRPDIQDLLVVPDRPRQQVLQPVRPAVPGCLGDGPAVVIVQFHQQAADQLAAGLSGLPPGKNPAIRPSRSASSADRASSATVAAATAASWLCLTNPS
jgi:hypothetical protein